MFRFVNLRDRIMNNTYKHGVLGVECPEDKNSEIYQKNQQLKETVQKQKAEINKRRVRSKIHFCNLLFFKELLEAGGTSIEDINFCQG